MEQDAVKMQFIRASQWWGARSRGTVLITVLLMVAVAALIASDIAYRQKLDIKRTSAFLSRDQAFQVLLAAEEIGHGLLLDDQDEDQRTNQLNDHLNEGWHSKIPPTPVLDGAGTVGGQVFDLQGRFNINSIFASNPQVAQAQKQRLASLFTNLQVPDPTLNSSASITSSGLVERIEDWIDPDDQPTGNDGREDDAYLAKRVKPYRTANHFIHDISELLLIEDFTQADIDKLREYICFLPPDEPLNLNTADEEVLNAYGFSTVQQFTSKRPSLEKQGFEYTNVNDVWPDLGPSSTVVQPVGAPGVATTSPSVPATNPGGAGAAPIGNFDVRSQFFMMEATAVINGKTVIMHSMLWRPMQQPGAAPPAGAAPGARVTPVKTILRKLVDPLKQV